MLVYNQKDKSENEHLRFILEAAGIGIWDLDPTSGQVTLDERCRQLFGVTVSENITYEDVLRNIYPEDAGTIDEVVKKALNSSAEETYEVRYRITPVLNKGIRWVLAKGKAYFNEDGIATRFAGTVQDITELMQDREKAVISGRRGSQEMEKEQALAASEAKFRSLIEEAPVATCLFVGKEMRIEVANQIMLDYWGKDHSVIGKPFEEALPEMIGQSFSGILEEVFRTGITYNDNAARADIVVGGVLGIYYFDFTYKPLRNAAGEVYAIMDMAVDVTEEVLARQKAEEAEASLRGAIELAELGTWQLNLVTGELLLSERLREWYGFDADEMLTADKAYAILRKEDRELVEKGIQQAAQGSVYDVEYRVYAAKERILHAQGKTFYNEKNEAYKIIGTAQDVTTQRTLQQSLEKEVQLRTEELLSVNEELGVANEELNDTNKQLLHSNEELAQYAYVASHDLQEPLRKIRLFSGMLESQESLPAENRPMVTKIAQSAERMSLLIRDLLEFSKLLKSEEHMRQVDLSAVLNAVISDFELTIEEKKATVRIGRLPVIEAVALQMNQLFYNLLSNALKFTRSDITPEIVIDAQVLDHEEARQYISSPFLYGNYYHITFSDNGIGFETKYAEQIFEVFKRLHGRHSYPGSGIGLALCKRIVTNHNGHIYVQSEVNRGTTFHIILADKNELNP